MPLYSKQIQDYTWANKPSVAPSGQIICVTDVGENGSLFRGNGTKWVRMHSVRYYDLAAAVVLTGTTTETTLATLTVKGGLMGAKGKLKVYPLFGCTNNANNKMFYIKAGGVSFSAILSTTNSASVQYACIIRNTNSESSQVSFASGNQYSVGNSSGAITTASVNTAADFTLAVSAQLANAGDTFTLHGLFVEIV